MRVHEGFLEKEKQFRLIRDGDIIADKLKLDSLKKFKTDTDKVESGAECGLSFKNCPEELVKGDIIECYELKQAAEY